MAAVHVLLALWQAMAQGRVCLDPEVCKRLWHLVAHGYDRVRSQRNPDIPASTHHIESRSGHFKPRALLTLGLKTETNTHYFVGLMARNQYQ